MCSRKRSPPSECSGPAKGTKHIKNSTLYASKYWTQHKKSSKINYTKEFNGDSEGLIFLECAQIKNHAFQGVTHGSAPSRTPVNGILSYDTLIVAVIFSPAIKRRPYCGRVVLGLVLIFCRRCFIGHLEFRD